MNDAVTPLQNALAQLLVTLDAEMARGWDSTRTLLRTLLDLTRTCSEPGMQTTAEGWALVHAAIMQALVNLETRQVAVQPLREAVREIARAFEDTASVP
jgi:hypothetical protein